MLASSKAKQRSPQAFLLRVLAFTFLFDASPKW